MTGRPTAGLHVQGDARVGGNGLCNLPGDLRQCRAILILLQHRDSIPPEPANLPIRQNRLQAVADLCPVVMVIHSQQHQHPTIRALAPNPPLLEKIDGITLDISAVERPHRHHGNLRFCLLINLLREGRNLLRRSRIGNPGKVVEVAGSVQGFR